MQGFRRKRNRLSGFDYASNSGYFITICVQNKRCLLCDCHTFELTAIGRVVRFAIEQIQPLHDGVRLEKYVIMPNHLHMILLLNQSAASISTLIQQMKRYISIQIGKAIWQRSFYDHVIRDEDDYQSIWEYIDTNQAKWQEDRFYIDDLSPDPIP